MKSAGVFITYILGFILFYYAMTFLAVEEYFISLLPGEDENDTDKPINGIK